MNKRKFKVSKYPKNSSFILDGELFSFSKHPNAAVYRKILINNPSSKGFNAFLINERTAKVLTMYVSSEQLIYPVTETPVIHPQQ